MYHVDISESEKQTWIKALRSGDYYQGRGALRIYDKGAYKYCCIGVFLDATKGHNGRWEDVTSCSGKYNFIGPIEEVCYDEAPEVLSVHSRYRDEHATLDSALMSLNDVCLLGFGDIADFVEKNVIAVA